MSRLYAWLDSDTGKQTTKTGNQRMNIQVNYGSKNDSKHLIDIQIYYPHTNLPDDESTPQVQVWHKGKRLA